MTNRQKKYVVGIDEAGRGPLAGPVSVAAVMYPLRTEAALKKVFASIKGKDSKKLTSGERDHWFGVIKTLEREGRLSVAQSGVGANVIDRIGIAAAIRRALVRSLKKINAQPSSTLVLLDGSLYAPSEYISQKTVIKGDEKELAIQLASIVAKVMRDKAVIRAALRYPGYGLEEHKGYGTRKHRAAIHKKGISAYHRKTFCRHI